MENFFTTASFPALIGILTLTAFVNALKCQTGIENGGYRTRLSSKPNAMCLYRAYPCDFDKPNEYGLKENVDPKDVSTFAEEEEADNGEEKLQNDESSVNDDVESAQSKGKQESDADESNVNDNLESAPSEDNGEEKFRTDESNVNDNLESAPSEDDTTPTLTEEEMTAPDDSESALNHGIGSADAKKRLKQYSSAQAAAENTGSTALTYSLPLLIIFLTKYLLRSLFGEEMAMM
uniref:Uncharacterized protein n=1 Tax=Angiostrongylus cantonensis TaxID=6313 RepID=A0A0K0DGG9_ANGCA